MAGSNLSTLMYEVCVGTTPYGCQAKEFAAAAHQPWTADGGLALGCGATYFMAVRGTNCGGLQDAVASAGAKLCCSGPASGEVAVLGDSGAEIAYATNTTALSVQWSGFAEACSGVRGYTISLMDAGGSAVFSVEVNATDELSVPLPAAVVGGLAHNQSYRANVMATSHAGLTGDAEATFVLDRTPPEPMTVYDGAESTDLACCSVSSRLGCSWLPVTDRTSGISQLEWALGTTPFGTDLQPFTALNVTSTSAEVNEQLTTTPPGTITFCTLRATNRAGLQTVAASDGATVIDDTSCDAPFACLPSSG